MAKITSIDPVERTVRRDPEEAIKELNDCIIAVNASMEVLAKMFPGATLLTGIVRGEPCCTLAFAASRDGDHFTLGAMNATRSLARVMLSMLPELQDVFALELKCAAELRSLEHDREVAVEAAIRAVRAEKRSE